jgi:hypothetical protein
MFQVFTSEYGQNSCFFAERRKKKKNRRAGAEVVGTNQGDRD